MVAGVAGAAVWFATRPADRPPRVSRLPITPSGAAALTINGADRDLAITPDGSRVVYVGNSGTQLFVRALDALEPVAVFTGAPRAPFVSPDGQWIGFVDGTTVLKKVAVTGGPAVTLATLDGTSRGATWGPDDTIIFATTNATTGLQRVAAAGGPTTVLTRPDRAQGEADHLWPELLPGGRAVLFTITARDGRPRCRTGGRPGSADRDAHDSRARRQSRALRAERPSRLRGGRHAAGGAVRPGPSGDARDAGAGRP